LKKRKRKGLSDASTAAVSVDQSSSLDHGLCKEYGLGVAKAAQLKAALEIGLRLGLSQLDEKYQIKSPADAANLVMMEMAFLLFCQAHRCLR
jgi:DNA repair protein RadC